MAAAGPLIPPFKWAQDKDNAYITVDQANLTDVKVTIEKNAVKFSAVQDKKTFAFDLELGGDLDAKASSFAAKAREVEFLLKKEKAGWWTHLLKDKNKYKQQCQIDWAHFRTEDDDEEEAAGKGYGGGFGRGGNPFAGMGGMPGMGGMGGMGGMPGMGGMGGMNMADLMGGMGGMGGMPGMGGMGGMPPMGDDDGGDDGAPDSDDEAIPSLDDKKKGDAAAAPAAKKPADEEAAKKAAAAAPADAKPADKK